MALFTLSESTSLPKLTQALISLNSSEFTKQTSLPETLVGILEKYCNGEFGFEEEESVSGRFQIALVRVVVRVSGDIGVYRWLLEGKFLELYTQLVEEALILGFQEVDVQEFLSMSLKYYEVALNKEFVGSSEKVLACLDRIKERVKRVSEKQGTSIVSFLRLNFKEVGKGYPDNSTDPNITEFA